MTWTTPRTWVTGEVVTAAQMNTHVRDNTDHLHDYDPTGRVVDLSDITHYSTSTSNSSTTVTVFDITGTGVVLGGVIIGYDLLVTAASDNPVLTIDGTANDLVGLAHADAANDSAGMVVVPPVTFDSSAKLTFTTNTSSNIVQAQTWVKEL